MEKKCVLIITDGADSTKKLADQIAASFAGSQVRQLDAEDFSPTDLLPADICFIGAEKPGPASFAPLEKLLLHINLAGRPGGLFTGGSAKTTAYLRKIVRDSELRVSAPYIAGAGGSLKTWIQTVK